MKLLFCDDAGKVKEEKPMDVEAKTICLEKEEACEQERGKMDPIPIHTAGEKFRSLLVGSVFVLLLAASVFIFFYYKDGDAPPLFIEVPKFPHHQGHLPRIVRLNATGIGGIGLDIDVDVHAVSPTWDWLSSDEILAVNGVLVADLCKQKVNELLSLNSRTVELSVRKKPSCKEMAETKWEFKWSHKFNAALSATYWISLIAFAFMVIVICFESKGSPHHVTLRKVDGSYGFKVCGRKITEVTSGGPASMEGVKKGRLLIAVNGVRCVRLSHTTIQQLLETRDKDVHIVFK